MGDVNESLEGLNKAIDRLIEDRAAALRRAEAAEAERRDAVRRENAAYLEREQSARLRYRAEVALLRWDTQAIGAALGLPIGADVPCRAVGAIKSLRERAEKAEAEVARFKGLLERAAPYIDQTGLGAAIYEAVKREAGAKPPEPWARTVPATNHPAGDVVKPPEPYTPRVGDVVGQDVDPKPGQVWSYSKQETSPVVVLVRHDVGEWWIGCIPAWGDATSMVMPSTRRYLRPATAEERAAAGLPPEPAEAPAAPRVLPEHLAYLEAGAAYWGTGCKVQGRWERMTKAAKDLLAAVALRDGGGK